MQYDGLGCPTPSICKNHEVLDAVDKAIFNAFGHSSLQALRAERVDMSKRACSQAKSSERRVVHKGGRPSKVNDSKNIAMVRGELMRNSQESSKLCMWAGPGGGAKEPTVVRHLTNTRFQIYALNDTLVDAMAFQTFLNICSQHFGFIRFGKQKSDYCDHCNLWHKRIVPKFWEFYKGVQTKLEEIDKDIWSLWFMN